MRLLRNRQDRVLFFRIIRVCANIAFFINTKSQILEESRKQELFIYNWKKRSSSVNFIDSAQSKSTILIKKYFKKDKNWNRGRKWSTRKEWKKNLIMFEFVTCFQQFHFIFINFIMMILSTQSRGWEWNPKNGMLPPKP